MQSALYKGWITHRRLGPTRNRFRYRLYMVWVDLAELPALFDGYWCWSARRPALAWFRRADYLGAADQPLDGAVRDLVLQRLHRRPRGAIRMLTHLRYYGYCFNPVTFYYCYDEHDRLDAIVAEITNTPWRERHQYVLDVVAARGDGVERRHSWDFPKSFHVSPFLPMDMNYEWHFDEPADGLHVYMRNERDGAPVFDATLSLRRSPITGASLAHALIAYPLMTIKVVVMIHWQALKLLAKRTPFYPHPAL